MIVLKSLKGRNTFSTVFQNGKKIYDGDCLGVFIYSNNNTFDEQFINCREEGVFYYGISVGKRIVRKATVRNRIKRLIRESIRQVINTRYADDEKLIFKYTVFNWRKAVEKPSLISLSDVYPMIERIFISAENYYLNRNYDKK